MKVTNQIILDKKNVILTHVIFVEFGVVKAWVFEVCEEPWKQNVPVPVHEPTVKYFNCPWILTFKGKQVYRELRVMSPCNKDMQGMTIRAVHHY